VPGKNVHHLYVFRTIQHGNFQDVLKSLVFAMKAVQPKDATLAAKICHILASASQPHSARIFASGLQHVHFVEEWCLKVFQVGGEMSLMQSMSALEMILRGRAVTMNPEVCNYLITN